jgi:Raf kinase inhibitor-like YbhB/YbcL family protein
MKIESPAFGSGEPIPRVHTCDGDDTSPDLSWRDVPEATEALALVVDDPDAPAGTWVHWLIWNVPATAGGMPGGVGSDGPPSGGVQGANSWGNARWQGPCPPEGTHRYYFRLFALDCSLALPAGASRGDLEKAMAGHVLAEAELMGRYARAGG